MDTSTTTVLDVKNLSVDYLVADGRVRAVDHVNLTVGANEIMGVIGESGCGKSTLAYAIMRLLSEGTEVTGTISVVGQNMYRLDPEQLRQFRWSKISMVFQSAINALNPVLNIKEQLVDTLLSHENLIPKRAAERAEELLAMVKIDRSRMQAYPHQLSGGMRQRVVIAMAIALKPQLVVMDEPTTALDVVVQRSILDQILLLKERFGFSVLFISHDIGLVAELSDRISVMYAGRIVELSDANQLLGEVSAMSHHPYTELLLKAIPRLDGEKLELQSIPGHPPKLLHRPSGCAFHDRCPYVEDRCFTEAPPLVPVGDSLVECHRYVGDRKGGDVDGQG